MMAEDAPLLDDFMSKFEAELPRKLQHGDMTKNAALGH